MCCQGYNNFEKSAVKLEKLNGIETGGADTIKLNIFQEYIVISSRRVYNIIKFCYSHNIYYANNKIFTRQNA